MILITAAATNTLSYRLRHTVQVKTMFKVPDSDLLLVAATYAPSFAFVSSSKWHGVTPATAGSAGSQFAGVDDNHVITHRHDMCACMHVCVCMHACLYVHACMYMCACMHVCVCMHACICVHACMYVCACMHVHVCMHTYSLLDMRL
jgi:hypothetical protein